MSNEKVYTLQQVTFLITDGKHGDCQNEDNSGYYFVSCKDVKEGQILYQQSRQITEKDFLETHKRTRFEPNDILLTNSGTIGRMAIAKDIPETYRTTFQKSVAIIKPNLDIVDPQWLYYYLNSEVKNIDNLAGGSAQKNLLLKDLRALKISVPPL
ncbi:MAG: restriction endonuclease subunit S, partial [Saprospiraceae bacterium]|nr:restriction endonuclease subunit S [Saprospiraceae bacterium]